MVEQLEHLCHVQGYKWSITHDRIYIARAWKERDRPIKVTCVGGGDIKLFYYRLMSHGESVDIAIDKLITLLNGDNPTWPLTDESLPITG